MSLATGMVSENDIILLVNIPSILFVMFMSISFSLAHHKPFDLLSAISAAISDQTLSTSKSLKHQSVISTLRITIASSGVLGSIIGVISMLGSMSDPRSVGPSMAVSLLCALYGVIISELLVAPLINRLRANTVDDASSELPSALTVSLYTWIHIPLMLVLFCMLLVCFLV